MSLYTTQKDLKEAAALLPEKYETYEITELANKYCEAIDNKDEFSKNVYIAALILRFWYVIEKMYQKVKTLGYEREDCFFKLFECINVACAYRAWQNPEKNTNAQACINQVISGRGVPAMVYEANLQKHASNNSTISLDITLDSDNDDTFCDQIKDETISNFVDDSAYSTVQQLISNDKLVEAIIIDNIAYKDVFKHEKKTISGIDETTGEKYKYAQHTSSFWPYKLVKELNSLDEDYRDYFFYKYNINKDKLNLALDDISKCSNSKLYKMVDKTLDVVRVNYI